MVMWGQTVDPTIVPTLSESPSVTPEPTATPLATPTNIETPTDTPSPTLTLIITETPMATETPSAPSQSADLVATPTGISVGTTETSSANTGNNTSIGGSGVIVSTGDATAYANLVNLVNSSSEASSVHIFFINVGNGVSDNIDLNALWKQMTAESTTSGMTISPATLTPPANTALTVNNTVAASANSGGNSTVTINGNSVVMTGDAVAIANVLNYINSYWQASRMLSGIINIQNFFGNIILPRPELFGQAGTGVARAAGSGDITITNSVTSMANSGGNNQSSSGGSESIVTGDSTAQAQATNSINQLFLDTNAYNLTINGQPILNFLAANSPGSNQSPEFRSYGPVTLTNTITTSATTGTNNQSGGSSDITTGNATAMTNLYNFINSQWLNSNWFQGVINVAGKWNGKIVFAYPDLAVSLDNPVHEDRPGEDVQLTVHYVNQGYDDAHHARIVMNIPEGMSYQGDSSGAKPSQNGQEIAWNFDDLTQGSSGQFVVSLKISSTIASGKPSSKFVGTVLAADNQIDLTTLVLISTIDPETDLSNNSAKNVVHIATPQTDTADEQIDHRQPTVEIGAKNNVGNYVYPSDIVTFEVAINNTSDVPLFSSQLTQKLFDADGREIFVTGLSIGTIGAHKSGTIRFGLPLATVFANQTPKAGNYSTSTIISGMAQDGTGVNSNMAKTSFTLAQTLVSRPSALNGKVAGATIQTIGLPPDFGTTSKVNLLPYLVLLSSSGGSVLILVKRLAFRPWNWRYITILIIGFSLFLFTVNKMVVIGRHNHYTVLLPKPEVPLLYGIDHS